jgi:RimJ/RimL family protein N-acetyltransferase
VNINDSLFVGKLLRLAPILPDDTTTFAKWTENDAYLRMLDDDPARPLSPEAFAQFEGGFINAPNIFAFRLRTLADDKLIGFVVLGDIKWPNQTALLGIGIGDPAYWGKGYGSDALRLILAYAFRELNLYRVGLNVIGYNTRAIRAYEKAGFVLEGRLRGVIHRDGQRYDGLCYGILRDEWAARPDSRAD